MIRQARLCLTLRVLVQDYNLRKRSEHLFKRLMLDGRTISVVHPETYAQRFMAFFQNLFIAVP